MNFVKFILVVAAVGLFAMACSPTATTPNTANATANANKPANAAPSPAATPAAEIASGKDLYAKNCMICHKENGTGGKVTIDGKSLDPNDLTADKMKNKSDEKLASNISEGAPDDGMPAFKGKLTADQMKSVVAHLRTLQGK